MGWEGKRGGQEEWGVRGREGDRQEEWGGRGTGDR